jgi:hypothetical protein
MFRKSDLSNVVDLSRQEPLPERAERNEADPELLERRQNLRFRLSEPDRVFALEGRDALDGMSTTNRLSSRFGESEVLDLALLDQVFHRPSHVFDSHVGVDAMLIEQVDRFDLESLERGLSDLLDVLGATIQASLLQRRGIESESELRGDRDLPMERTEGFAHELFVRKRTVDFGRIEEGHASFDRHANQRDHLLLVCRRTVPKAHSHTAQADRRDFQIAFPQFALLHC